MQKTPTPSRNRERAGPVTIEREEKTRRLERERAVRRSEELTHLVDEFRAGAFLDRLLEASPWNELLRSTEAVAQALDTLQVTLFFLAEGSAPLADVKAAIAALHSGLHGVECANTRLRHQMTAQGVCRLSQVIPDVEEYYRIMHDMQANLRLHQSLLYLLRGLTK